MISRRGPRRAVSPEPRRSVQRRRARGEYRRRHRPATARRVQQQERDGPAAARGQTAHERPHGIRVARPAKSPRRAHGRESARRVGSQTGGRQPQTSHLRMGALAEGRSEPPVPGHVRFVLQTFSEGHERGQARDGQPRQRQIAKDDDAFRTVRGRQAQPGQGLQRLRLAKLMQDCCYPRSSSRRSESLGLS